MDLNEFAVITNSTSQQLADVVQPYFPGLNRPLISKARNPQHNGIRLVARAEKLLRAKFAVSPQEARRGDGHRLSLSIRCRVSESKFEGVHTAIKRRGYDTIQSGMDALLDYFIAHEEILDKKRQVE